MKNILFTTLFAGCFAVSSVFADDAASSKSGCMTVNAKVSTGVAFAGNVKNKYITYGTSGKYDDTTRTATANAGATSKNTKKKSSAFIGVTLGTKYNFNDQFALGGDIFYDAMNVKLQLKKGVEGLADESKIRGAYGLMAVFAYTPLSNLSFDLGAGIAKTTKIKDLHMYDADVMAANNKDLTDALNSVKFRNKIGFVAKASVNYVFNDNLALGIDLKMQKVKAKNKKLYVDRVADLAKGVAKFKCNLYTIGATLTYTF